MIRAGMNVARIGLAHNTIDEGLERYRRIRSVAADEGARLGTLVDLPGPKVRAAGFGDAPVDLSTGGSVELRIGQTRSTAAVIEVDYDGLLTDVQVGDRLTVGDGGAVLEVADKTPDKMLANIVFGGRLRGSPGIHVPSDRLQMATPTPDDFVALDAFVDAGIDMIAVSFVRSAHDIRRVGTEPHPRGPLLIAKIETRAAVDNLPGIIEAGGCDHGGARRPRQRVQPRGPAPPPEADHPGLHRRREAGDHRDADARVDDHQSRPDPRRGVRCRQRRVRRLLRGDALRGDRDRGRSGQRRADHEQDRPTGRRGDELRGVGRAARGVADDRSHRRGPRR